MGNPRNKMMEQRPQAKKKIEDVNLLRKHLCRKCKWRTNAGVLLSDTSYDKYVDRERGELRWACGYLYYTKNCCIDKDGKDKRGSDPSKCKLFREGECLEKKSPGIKLVEISQPERYDINPYYVRPVRKR